MEQVKFLRSSRAVDSLKHHSSDNCYIFSKNGHGRTGIIGGCMLGRLYGTSVPDTFEMNQRLHDVRQSMQDRPPHLQISTPQLPAQRQQIELMLSKTEPIYKPIERRDDTDFHMFRTQQRGMGIPLVHKSMYPSASVAVQAAIDGTPLEVARRHRGVGVDRIYYERYEKRAVKLADKRAGLGEKGVHVYNPHFIDEALEARGGPELPDVPEHYNKGSKVAAGVRTLAKNNPALLPQKNVEAEEAEEEEEEELE